VDKLYRVILADLLNPANELLIKVRFWFIVTVVLMFETDPLTGSRKDTCPKLFLKIIVPPAPEKLRNVKEESTNSVPLILPVSKLTSG
jgi:hypothetical protein